ncbi:MAG: InlB B-repeat-containing protein, partial [Firmicutes bacterium]|nr:InlB B-repeat-containing protein [Bacillota bacterium]
QTGVPELRDIVTKEFLADLYNTQVTPAQLQQKYDTPFVMGVDMGGRLQSTYLLESNEQSSIDSVNASISTQFNYGIGGSVEGGAELDWRQEAKSKGVTHNTEIWVLGGDSQRADGTDFDFSSDNKVRDQYAEWAGTLRYAPALMGLGRAQDIVPLWSLIDGAKDKPEYSFVYQDGTSTNSLTRSAQLQEYFYQYGRESYVNFMNSYGKEVSLPDSIVNITVNKQEMTQDPETGRNVFYVRPERSTQEQAKLNFDVLPLSASFFDKEYSVQPHEGNYLTVSSTGVINLADNAEQYLGDIVEIVVSAGGVRQIVSVKVDKVYDITYDAGEGDFDKDPYGVPVQQIVSKVHYKDSVQSVSNTNRGKTPREPKKEGFVHDNFANRRQGESDDIGANYLDGWVDAQGEPFEFGYQPNRDIVLYPKWRQEFFEVTFDAGDGKFEHNGNSEQVQVVKFRYNELPKSMSLLGRDDPVKDGLDDNGERLTLFDAWYTTKNNSEQFVFNQTFLEKDVTVYAQYKQNRYFVVEFDLDGGQGNETTNRQNVPQINGPGGTLIGYPQKPAKDPFKKYQNFKGWYVYNEYNEFVPFTFDYESGAHGVIEHSTIFYAVYDAPNANLVNFTLVDEDGQTVQNGWKILQVLSGDKVPYQSAPVVTNYDFVDWYTTPLGTEKYGFNAIVDRNLVIYGRLKKATYRVQFNLNGGNSASIPDQTILGGGTAVKPADPTAQYRVFAGWTKDSAGNQPFSFDSPISAHTMLYAQWGVNDPETGIGKHTVRMPEKETNHSKQTWGEDNYYDTVYFSDFGLDKRLLQSLGYTYVQITMTINVAEKDDGYQYVNLYKTSKVDGEPYHQIKFEHGANYKETGYYDHTLAFRPKPIEYFDDTSFVIRYGSSGIGNNDWKHKELRVTVTFVKRWPPEWDEIKW